MEYSIGKTAELLGVTIQTVRNWEEQGKIKSIRSAGNHRRFSEDEINRILCLTKPKNEKITLGYARVSTYNRRNDLEKQINAIEKFCIANGWRYKTISDIGSDLKYDKKGLLEVIKLIETNQVCRLVINYKDRLLRFGSEIIFEMCKYHDVEIVVITEDENKFNKQELAQDMITIVTDFSTKLYGKQSTKNKKILEDVKGLMNIEENH